MGHKPPIPEKLSTEGKDFLGHCLESEPKRRWTASMLLDHPFVKVRHCYGKWLKWTAELMFKGQLLCKMHFLMCFIHKMCPRCRDTQRVRKYNPPFSSVPTSLKIGGSTELIQICCGHGDITKMWAGFTLNSWQGPAHGPMVHYQKRCCIRNNVRRVLGEIWSVFTLASI